MRRRLLRTQLRMAADELDQDLYVSDALAQTGRVMVKDENVCLHCGLCAERCPDRRLGYAAFPLSSHEGGPAMQLKQAINDFVIKFANVNGTGSASANGMFAKVIFRMGIPVSPRNIFPSNIQGHAYLV